MAKIIFGFLWGVIFSSAWWAYVICYKCEWATDLPALPVITTLVSFFIIGRLIWVNWDKK